MGIILNKVSDHKEKAEHVKRIEAIVTRMVKYDEGICGGTWFLLSGVVSIDYIRNHLHFPWHIATVAARPGGKRAIRELPEKFIQLVRSGYAFPCDHCKKDVTYGWMVMTSHTDGRYHPECMNHINLD